MNLHDWPWQAEPDHTRLLRALRREGDARHVPVLELFADMEVIDHALGEPPVSLGGAVRDVVEQLADRKIRFWHRLGYDAFWQGPITGFQFARLESADTAEVRKTRRTWVNEGVGLIANMADFEQYPWPKPEQVDYYPMEYAARHLPEGMAIIAQVPGTLEHAMWLMGYETFALALYEQPELIEAVFAKIEEISLPISRSLAQMDGVMALWMGDDMGYKTATMISPKDLRKHVFPIQKQIAAIAHAQGIPFMLHSCGDLDTVIDDLIDDVGIDCKHSFEDVIEPVEHFAARFGQRISIVGGVDVDLLCRGTPDQIRRRTRAILEYCAPGKGYVLGSGNTFANYIPLSNFLTMLDEGRRFNAGM